MSTISSEDKQALFHRMKVWRTECDFQADQFELLGNEATIVPHRIEMAATYFIVAAGCVYYHAKEIFEDKLGTTKGRKHLDDIIAADPDLQAIIDRRNWLNHGAVSSTKGPRGDNPYKLAKHHHLSIQTSFDTGQSKTIKYSIGWIGSDTNSYKDMTDWHTKARTSLDRLLTDTALLTPGI